MARRQVVVPLQLPSQHGDETKNQIVGLAFHRARGDRRFGENERNLLDLFMRKCSHLLGDWSRLRDDALVASLTPRQRDTLALILTGKSEKEIAASFGISAHTVHVYVKSLHRHFRVRSRAELMSRFIDRTRLPA